MDVPFQIQLQKEFSSGIKHVVWLYDVSCKFSINAFNRSFYNPYSPLEATFKERLKDKNFIKYLVGVWHGNSHKSECGDEFSLRYTPLTGMVTGEEIETGWKRLNKKQYSIREMDAGGRIDSVTVQVIDHNADKIKRMGKFNMKTKSYCLTFKKGRDL